MILAGCSLTFPIAVVSKGVPGGVMSGELHGTRSGGTFSVSADNLYCAGNWGGSLSTTYTIPVLCNDGRSGSLSGTRGGGGGRGKFTLNDGITGHFVYGPGALEIIAQTGSLRSPPSPTPRRMTDPDRVVSASSGSGFAVSSNGHVITNHHVIEGCQKVKIRHNGKSIPATVVTSDPRNDLALLKGDFRPSSVLPLSTNSPELLQDVYVAGFPFGRKVSTGVKVTKGIISSLTGIGNNFSNIQIDAALQPGNSGGPILDDKGNVVGVAVARLDKVKTLQKLGSLPENTNFGIKTSVVRSILESQNVSPRKPNTASISKIKLGTMISDGTYYLSCWMTTAQIKEMRSRKVIFQNLD